VGARAMTDESNNSILLLIDGREEMIEVSGFPVWGATVASLSQIERIEVIRGPGSALYGANAYAGVVIITTLPDRPDVGADVELNLGELKRRQIFGRVRGSYAMKSGVLTFVGSAGIDRRADPSYRAGTTYQSDLKARGVVRYRIGQKLDLSLDAGFQTASGDTHLIIGDLSAKPGAILAHEMIKAKFKLGENTKLAAQLFHNWYEFSFQTRMRIWALGTWVTDLPDMDTFNHSIDGQVQVDHQATERILFIFGGNLRYTSNDTPQFSPAFVDDVRGAGFVHAEWKPTDTLQLTGGLRLDLNSQTDMALSPRAVMVVRPYPDHAFRLGYGLAFRKPAAVENQWHLDIEDAAFPEVIEKLRTAVGNEELVNEKVHSFEAGWRGRFLDERLRVAVDLFYNIYKDMIYFKTEMIWEMGRPNILDSTFQFLNQPEKIHAAGGEIEVTFAPTQSTAVWGNLGLRRVVEEDGQPVASEPIIRANLGCWWRSRLGLVVDLAFHYVSSYEMAVVLPEEPFDVPVPVGLGNNLLVIGRVGYSLTLGTGRALEAGLTVRAPLGPPVLEFPGYPVRRSSYSVTVADFGGEMIVRLVSFYLRGSF
jgi:iron complex outermembrane receptor protein